MVPLHRLQFFDNKLHLLAQVVYLNGMFHQHFNCIQHIPCISPSLVVAFIKNVLTTLLEQLQFLPLDDFVKQYL